MDSSSPAVRLAPSKPIGSGFRFEAPSPTAISSPFCGLIKSTRPQMRTKVAGMCGEGTSIFDDLLLIIGWESFQVCDYSHWTLFHQRVSFCIRTSRAALFVRFCVKRGRISVGSARTVISAELSPVKEGWRPDMTVSIGFTGQI